MRIQKLRESMANSADGALITAAENVRYYSGFTGDSSQLLITKDSQFLFTDFRYAEHAEKETEFKVVVTKGDSRNRAIFEYAKKEKIKCIGIDLSGVSFYAYKSYLAYISESDIVDLSLSISLQRCIKDADEISAIRKGAQHNDKLFSHICGLIKPGVSENEIKAQIIYFMNRQGADSSFSPVTASGQNSSLPHATPSGKKIKEGDFVTLDYGCKFDGYCSDFTRTVAVCHIDKDMQKVYDIVKYAGDKALAALKPGVAAKSIDAIARDYIASMGYADAFGHGLGHGVGLGIHEAPSLNDSGDTLLEPGMVVTIEPGIYLKGRYGVRIEDLCVITDGGCENLTSAPRDLIII